MKSHRTVKVKRKFRIRKFYVFVALAFIIAATVTVYFGATEMNQMRRERAEIVAQIKEQDEQQASLSSKKSYYESDSYIEQVARDKLGLVKNNDVIFIDTNK